MGEEKEERRKKERMQEREKGARSERRGRGHTLWLLKVKRGPGPWATWPPAGLEGLKLNWRGDAQNCLPPFLL